jgi:putative protease
MFHMEHCVFAAFLSTGKDHRDYGRPCEVHKVELRELGITRFRIDLLRETPEQVGPLLDRYAHVIAGRDDGRETWRQLRALNQLGVTRGTLQLV